ncbi:hypothetical protein P280DRAFT_188816 [Massarina eburnea CBS 473.64]|uniref:BZIP domain-containing protein n=1 Tax=Massarina eburnea CBS 473.64 TaxID=1395130 RepID=A0A6A6SCW7_9PLEO|nr:hypothetical protein P280DRAFT_188816 [Massarina eburnea CBS 473.64]
MDASSLSPTHLSTIIVPSAMNAAQTPSPTVDPSSTTTIKMEDLQVPFSSSTPSSTSSSSPPPTSEGKQVKKRKSWGQVLPEPKTSLPPRKRAKTEDEKEQRRIERVKRNRLAAHNSRERKRQEYDMIQSEKDQLEADLAAARQTIARQNVELQAYRKKFPGEIPASFDMATPTSELDSFLSDTIDPSHTTSSSFPSPVSMTIDSMDSPRDESCQPETPDFTEVSADFDQTRYPAEILCDLQCRSTSADSLPAIWAFLSLFNLTIPSTMRSLSSLFSTSISSQTPPTGALLSPFLAWWTMMSASPRPFSDTMISTLAFLTLSMQNTSTCRQPSAQLTLATGLSQRRTSIDLVARSIKGSRWTEGSMRQRRLRSLRLKHFGAGRKRTSSSSSSSSLGLRKEITRALARSIEGQVCV